MSFAKYNNGCPWKQRPHARTNGALGLDSDKTMSFAKYNNGFSWKKRPHARSNRGLGLVWDETMSFAKYNYNCPCKQVNKQEQISVSVWCCTKQCRLESTIVFMSGKNSCLIELTMKKVL